MLRFGDVSVTSDTTPARESPDNRFDSTNLLTNFDSRGKSAQKRALIDLGTYTEDYWSCYQSVELNVGDDFIFGLDLS